MMPPIVSETALATTSLSSGCHVRQGGAERGQQEPVDAEHGEHRYVKRHAAVVRDHQRGRRYHEQPADRRGPDEDLPPRPAVDEHSGEWPDQRVRQVEDRERGGPRRRARERAGIEEHVGADRGGEDAVPGLRDEAGAEELPEVPLGEDHPQVAAERGPPMRLRTGTAYLRHSIIAYGHAFSLIRRQQSRQPLVAGCSGPRAGSSRSLAVDLALDELLHQVAAHVVAELLGRRLHEVGTGRDDRAADAAVLGDLAGAQGVDDDAGRVR